MRSLVVTLLILITLAITAPVGAQQYAGYAQRNYRGKTYIYQPVRYHAPVWYAGNGIVRSKDSSRAPLWSGARNHQDVR